MKNRNSKTIMQVIIVCSAILLQISCKSNISDKPNGWYFLDNKGNIEGDAIVTAKDFAWIKLDSIKADKTIYEIVIFVKEDKIEKFANATEKAIGKGIGFLYNGEILCKPIPNYRLDSGNSSISFPDSYDYEKIKDIFTNLKQDMDEVSAINPEDEIYKFDSLFNAWKENYKTNPLTQLSSSTLEAKKLDQYPRLLAMGKQIIPSVILKLQFRDNFFALSLYDELQDNDSLKSFSFDKGEQFRAQETIKKFVEIEFGVKKRNFKSDKERIDAIRKLFKLNGWEEDTELTQKQKDSIIQELDYELTEKFLQSIKEMK